MRPDLLKRDLSGGPALSAYLHYSVRGHVPQMSIDLAMRLLLDGSLNEDYPLSRQIIEWGEYGRALQAWLSVWPAESFLVIHQERLRDAPRDVRASLESHLAIPGLAAVSPRPNRGPYGPYRREWWNVSLALEESAPGFGRRLAARGMRSIDVRAFSRFPAKHAAPQLSDDVRAELAQ